MISFVDALFIAASSISDTGLTTVPIATQFNMFGEMVIFFLFILGGLGWYALKIFILSFFLHKAIKHRNLKQYETESGNSAYSESLGIMKVAVVTTFSMIVVFGLSYSLFFMFGNPIHNPLYEAVGGVSNPDLYGNYGRSL